MGMSVLRLAAVAQLLVGCRSFLLPSPEIPRLEQRTGPNRATSPFETLRSWRGAYGVPSISPRDANRGARPSQVLTSPDDVSPGNQSLGDSADSNGAFKPSVLWWTRSRAEEVATLNLVTNAGIMAGVALFALSTVFTVDLEVSRGWTATEFFLRVPVDNWLGYLAVLRNDPVLVKACTSGLVYAVGDWTAQTVEGAALAEIKRGRVLRSALAGLLLHGPLSHVWYDLCEGAFDGIGWNSYWWVPGPKIIADQLLWGPFWNAVYICFLGTLKKDSLNTIKEAVVTTAFPLVLAGIRLWPLAHLVTYGLIPTENRLLWVDFVEIIWVTILSKQAAEQARSAEEEK